MAMVGRKRSAAWVLPCSRPTKLRRQESGHSDISDAVAKSMESTLVARARRDGYEPAVFLNAPARAISSFDWSDLVDVLNFEAFVSPDNVDDVLMNVPGVVRKVPISRRAILKEIIGYLQLEVSGFGFVFESDHVMRAWIEMEVPSCGVLPAKKRERFLSDEAFDKYEAMEGACTAAISYLQKECFVLVEDINSAEIKSLRKRALAAESFASLLNDVVDGGREDNAAMRTAYASFCLEGRRLCKDYSDVFPAGIIGFESTSSAPDDGEVYYDGRRPPMSRVEQFAFKLVKLINRSGNVSVLGHDVVQK